jgi:RluA family pseudouridine synthase
MLSQKTFKPPPKRFQPRGLTILYEDRDIIVVDKISGLLTMSSEREKEKTAYYLLTKYVRKGNPKSRDRIFIVHRLDRDTSGVLIFAKSESAKRFLQAEWQNFSKTYFAVVHGSMQEKHGTITSYLAENAVHKVFSTTDPSLGKLSKTGYKVIRETNKYSLLEISLLTGRKNQIRVHLADIGNPVAGDKKYGIKGKGVKRLALHAATIIVSHPHTKEKMTFEAKPPEYFDSLIRRFYQEKPVEKQ